MEQTAINEAVTNCLRGALGKHDPLMALQDSLDALRAEGWPLAEIENVKKACLRMLTAIYDPGGAEQREQDG